MAPPTDPPPDCPGLDDCGPAQPLRDRIDRLESSVRIVAAGHVTLTQQVAELSLGATAQGQRMDKMAADLADNSKATRETLQAALEIRDIVTTGRTMGRLAKWLAPTLVAVAVALGVLKGWAVDVGAAIKAAGQK